MTQLEALRLQMSRLDALLATQQSGLRRLSWEELLAEAGPRSVLLGTSARGLQAAAPQAGLALALADTSAQGLPVQLQASILQGTAASVPASPVTSASGAPLAGALGRLEPWNLINAGAPRTRSSFATVVDLLGVSSESSGDLASSATPTAQPQAGGGAGGASGLRRNTRSSAVNRSRTPAAGTEEQRIKNLCLMGTVSGTGILSFSGEAMAPFSTSGEHQKLICISLGLGGEVNSRAYPVLQTLHALVEWHNAAAGRVLELLAETAHLTAFAAATGAKPAAIRQLLGAGDKVLSKHLEISLEGAVVAELADGMGSVRVARRQRETRVSWERNYVCQRFFSWPEDKQRTYRWLFMQRIKSDAGHGVLAVESSIAWVRLNSEFATVNGLAYGSNAWHAFALAQGSD